MKIKTKNNIEISAIKAKTLEKLNDSELLDNKGLNRPYLIIIKLKYKTKKYNFAIPLRSNISPTTNIETFFKLPNVKNTKDKHHHGLHFLKMFPINKSDKVFFQKESDLSMKIIMAFIDKNFKNILKQAQEYLNKYEEGNKYDFHVNIDSAIDLL